jgi:hypothetical protein
MQARVLPDDIDQFEGQLIEGKVYALSDFTVDDTRESYMTCSNEFTMYFGRQTVVNEIEGDIDSIPLHSFEFIDFKNLHSRCDNSILTGRFFWNCKFDQSYWHIYISFFHPYMCGYK